MRWFVQLLTELQCCSVAMLMLPKGIEISSQGLDLIDLIDLEWGGGERGQLNNLNNRVASGYLQNEVEVLKRRIGGIGFTPCKSFVP